MTNTGGEDRRKLCAVLYCNPAWAPARDGGAELLLDEAGQCWRSVAPAADTLLLFRTDRVLRKVAPARADRCSLSISFLGVYE